MQIVATCGLGLEELLAREVASLVRAEVRVERGAVSFSGEWPDVWRANWCLRTANRVLVVLGSWPASDGDALANGARRLVLRDRPGLEGMLHPERSFAVRATCSASAVRDQRWAALRVKDGLVDGQRARYGRRAEVDRSSPALPLRLRVHRNEATLSLDSSGEPLDRRGYREVTTEAPLREHLAAACLLAASWEGGDVVVDPMCGSGTLLAEAGRWALGLPPRLVGRSYACEGFPGFDPVAFDRIRGEPLPAPAPDVRLVGFDRSARALEASRRNLEAAGLADRIELRCGDAFVEAPPPGPGLLLVNPAYGERLDASAEEWRRLGDLLKQRYQGWRAVVLAGDRARGKGIGLRPSRRIPVRNGPIDARILVFDLY